MIHLTKTCAIALLSTILLLTSVVEGIPDGWAMTDRFAGCRYEITGANLLTTELRKTIVEKADELACFGWVQNNVDNGSVVGESRCNKKNGLKFKSFLEKIGNDVNNENSDGVTVEHVEIKDYEDSKIKLHFSHFKILDDERNTCFREPPHQCKEFTVDAATEDGNSILSSAKVTIQGEGISSEL